MSEIRQNFRRFLFDKTFAEITKRYPTLSRKERRQVTRELVDRMWTDYCSMKTAENNT